MFKIKKEIILHFLHLNGSENVIAFIAQPNHGFAIEKN